MSFLGMLHLIDSVNHQPSVDSIHRQPRRWRQYRPTFCTCEKQKLDFLAKWRHIAHVEIPLRGVETKPSVPALGVFLLGIHSWFRFGQGRYPRLQVVEQDQAASSTFANEEFTTSDGLIDRGTANACASCGLSDAYRKFQLNLQVCLAVCKLPGI